MPVPLVRVRIVPVVVALLFEQIPAVGPRRDVPVVVHLLVLVVVHLLVLVVVHVHVHVLVHVLVVVVDVHGLAVVFDVHVVVVVVIILLFFVVKRIECSRGYFGQPWERRSRRLSLGDQNGHDLGKGSVF